MIYRFFNHVKSLLGSFHIWPYYGKLVLDGKLYNGLEITELTKVSVLINGRLLGAVLP